MRRFGPGQCQQCGEYTSESICRTCLFVEKARGRAWAEGAAEVLRPLIEQLTPIYNITMPTVTNPDIAGLKSFIDTLEKKP